MAFPLVANPVSAGLEMVSPVEFQPDLKTLDLDITRTTRWRTMFTHSRTVDVEEVTPYIFTGEHTRVDIAASFHHEFVGIGGIRYIPSFPQLERDNTTFPHAF